METAGRGAQHGGMEILTTLIAEALLSPSVLVPAALMNILLLSGLGARLLDR